MASSVDESILEEFDVYELQIIRLQALIRGRLVRKCIKQIKQDYLEVFREIEQSDKYTVEWPYNSLCYPLIQKARRQVTSASRSNQTSRRSSTSSPRDSPTVNIPYEKENQMKWCKDDGTGAEHRHVNRVGSSPRECSPRSDLSERSGSTSKFQDQTSQKTKQTEHDKQSESLSSRRCSNIEQDLEIQNFSPVSTEIAELPLNENVELGNRSVQTAPKSELNRDFVLCSVETQTSLIENIDLISEETKVSELGDLGENQRMTSKVDLSSQIQSREKFGQDLIISDKVHADMHQESQTDDNIYHKKANHFQKHDMSEKGEQLLEIDNVQKTRQFHERQENERSPDYTTRMSKKSELTSLTNVTSVWDSVSSYQDITSETSEQIYPTDQASLQEMRKNIAMELLWVQQAINSRKNYLRLKKDMDLSNTAATRS